MPHYGYILASRRNGTLYIGMTSDLVQRGHQHRTSSIDGFTKTYGVKLLVYFEAPSDVRDAIQREKTMKHWRRDWKTALIQSRNPDWRDLYDDPCH